MQEFWVCQGCKSLNRMGTGRCYRCRLRYGHLPKAEAPVIKNAGAVGATAAPPAAAPAPAAAGYRSTSFSLSQAAAELPGSGGLRRPHPTDPIRRRVARALAARPYVGVWWLGYVAAATLALLLLDAIAFVAALAPTALRALEAGSVDKLTSLLSKPGAALLISEVSLGILAIFGLLCFSLFLGLTTHNALGLGAEMPVLTPYRAGVCWLEAAWAQIRLAAALLVPPVLFLVGYPIIGGIIALVLLEIVQRRLEDPIGWLTRPFRHLVDLVAKLGLDGAGRSKLALLWAGTFIIANVLAVLAWLIPLAVLLVRAATAISRRQDLLASQTSGLAPYQMAVAIVVGGFLAALAAAVGLLVPIAVQLARAQRTRRALVIAGRTRPWTPRTLPGYADADRLRDEDELVDRTTFDEPEFGIGGATALGDHASLYSPSTTSSSPSWARRPSSEPPV